MRRGSGAHGRSGVKGEGQGREGGGDEERGDGEGTKG